VVIQTTGRAELSGPVPSRISSKGTSRLTKPLCATTEGLQFRRPLRESLPTSIYAECNNCRSLLTFVKSLSCGKYILGGYETYVALSGAFANLRKVTISFFMPVRPSVCFRPAHAETGFRDIYFGGAVKAVEKIRLSLKSNKNGKHIT